MPTIRQIQQNTVPLRIEWLGIVLNVKYRPGMWNQEFTDAIQSGDEAKARAAFVPMLSWWDLTEDVDDPDNPGQTNPKMEPITAEVLDRLPGPMRTMLVQAIARDIAASMESSDPNSSAASPPTSSAVASLEPVPNGTSG